MGHLPDTKLWVAHAPGMPGKISFPHHWLKRKPLVSDPSIHHGTCAMHVPWCMSGSVTWGDGVNVAGVPSACAPRNFTYLITGPWQTLTFLCRSWGPRVWPAWGPGCGDGSAAHWCCRWLRSSTQHRALRSRHGSSPGLELPALTGTGKVARTFKTPCGLLTPYGKTDLGQHLLR